MPIAILMELPGVTTDAYDQVTSNMGIEGAPDGAISHACLQTDGGLRIIDVWESREAHDTFVRDLLRPAMDAAGFEPSGEGPQELKVHYVAAREYMPARAA